MNASGQHAMSSLRSLAVGSVITAAVLLSPAFAFLIVIAAETLIDFVMEVGAPALLAVAAAAIGWFLLRKMSPHPKLTPLSADDDEALDESAIAAPST
jgi:hypothetical protein